MKNTRHYPPGLKRAPPGPRGPTPSRKAPDLPDLTARVLTTRKWADTLHSDQMGFLAVWDKAAREAEHDRKLREWRANLREYRAVYRLCHIAEAFQVPSLIFTPEEVVKLKL